jgi:peptide-methionine (S)-S-oxide reductase
MKAALILAAILGLASSASGDPSEAAAKEATAYFAAGCFWCSEHDFEAVPGVRSVTSGYIGGETTNPTYEQVSSGRTGHTEGIAVVYDSQKVTYEKLLEVFWRNVDPVAVDAQFCDHGRQYRSAIFYRTPEEKALAEKTRAQVQTKLKEKVATEVAPAGKFWPAEEYHQDYAKKNPLRYKFYRFNCGRDARLKELRGRLDAS